MGLCLFLCAVPARSAAQSSQPDNGRMGFALIPSLGVIHPGLGGGIEGCLYNLGGFNHTLRINVATEFLGGTDSSDAHIENGYLIGKWNRNRFGYASWRIGIGFVETTFKGRKIAESPCKSLSCPDGIYEIRKPQTFGVPFQFDAVLAAKVIGLGLSIKGNANPDRFFAGVTFLVPFGWIP